ncbi:MAG: histidine--tRNA ligase [Alphaproteobacteria bacterium]
MSDTKQRIHRPQPVTGYPEWLPEVRLVEQRWLDRIRAVFESYGFCSIETPSVEEIEVLVAKGGDADKEIYALHRLQEDQRDNEPRVALHYDLTVPLARYVAMHYNDLVFPFKRYQIQRAWRGERPQEGRFREFCQCDIDVIDNEKVSLHFDAEIPAIIYEILQRLEVGAVGLHINNRKILEGFYRGIGITDVVSAIRIVDKLDKIGRDGVRRGLVESLGLPGEVADSCLALAEIRTPDGGFVDRVRALGVRSELLDQGLDELRFVFDELSHIPHGVIMADLSIARGFDYYTGTVYEGKLRDFPTYPSICSGGRYDNLVGAYLRKNLPGVGMSIGLTRIFAKLLKEGLIPPGPKCPTEVMVAFLPGHERAAAAAVAASLRQAGIRVEMYHEPKKVDAQMRYAARKGIPYVWFPAPSPGAPHEVKDMSSGQQAAADPATWRPGTSVASERVSG